MTALIAGTPGRGGEIMAAMARIGSRGGKKMTASIAGSGGAT